MGKFISKTALRAFGCRKENGVTICTPSRNDKKPKKNLPRPPKRKLPKKPYQMQNFFPFDFGSNTIFYSGGRNNYSGPWDHLYVPEGGEEYFLTISSFMFLEKSSPNIDAFNDWRTYMSHLCLAGHQVLPYCCNMYYVNFTPITYFVNRLDIRYRSFTYVDTSKPVGRTCELNIPESEFYSTSTVPLSYGKQFKKNYIYHNVQPIRNVADATCRAICTGNLALLPPIDGRFRYRATDACPVEAIAYAENIHPIMYHSVCTWGLYIGRPKHTTFFTYKYVRTFNEYFTSNFKLIIQPSMYYTSDIKPVYDYPKNIQRFSDGADKEDIWCYHGIR